MSSSWRTTEALVAGIIETDSTIVGSTLSGLAPFIDVANVMVTRWCTDSKFGYSLFELELIERWLSAHFYAIRDPRVVSEAAGSVSQSYETRVDLGLQNTRYGQQVMLIDGLGALAALQKRAQTGVPPRPGIIWAGKRLGRRWEH